MRPLLSNRILSCRRGRIIFPIGIAAGFLLLAGCQRVMTLGMNSYRHRPIAGYRDSDSPLLLAAYADMENDPQAPQKRVHNALARIVNLYEAWHAAEPGKDQAEKAAEWRAKLPDTDPDSPSP